MTEASYDPICPKNLEDAAITIHAMLDHCEYGEHIMAIGSLLRFLESFDSRYSFHSDAYIVLYGRDDERDDIVHVVTVEALDDTITFGRGEHFSPGPSKGDLNIAYDRFSISRGEPVDLHMLDDWVALAQNILENVERIDGSH